MVAAFADLERVVRPVTVKDIRPTGVQATRAADPSAVTITGSSVKIVELNHTYSTRASRQTHQEQERMFDLVRVENPDDSEQYVKAEIPTKLKLSLKGLQTQTVRYAPVPADAENVTIEKRNVVRANPDYGKVITP